MQVTQENAPARNRHVWFLSAIEAAMLALILLGVFVSAVEWNFAGQGSRAREATTMASLATIERGLLSYQVATGAYPSTLNQLVPMYVTSIPLDGWKRPFIYAPTPGGPKPFDLRSAGPDGVAGTGDDI